VRKEDGMKTVKCYNIKGLVDSHKPMQEAGITTWGFDDKLVIEEGPEGVFVMNRDGQSWFFKSVEAKLRIDLGPDEEGKISLVPTHHIEPPIRDIMEHCESEDVALGDFVRRFGGRLERNYREAMDLIEKAGLDPKDYPRDSKRKAG
jgi:hypothetical protein